ncbi:MAG TPA: cytochrome c3 family protein [Candidatus Krumholzibacteria bacterium]|nr:cytochrome c3 family protein [Candidatus Krumholzibacteria bacterium]
MTQARGIRYSALASSCAVLLACLCVWAAVAQVTQDENSPHLNSENGVLRINEPWAPRGSCNQCHDMHAQDAGSGPYPGALFAENTNTLCYADGAGPCHSATPSNYPATESSRIPSGFPNAGYFEYNAGGSKVWGVAYRDRWPGKLVYDNPGVVGANYYSPHRNDPDMGRLDAEGQGSCLNCHDPHGSQSPFDMLVANYGGIGGHEDAGYPTRYELCFSCHSNLGPIGMEPSGRYVADYYDSSLNGDFAGHQIQMNPAVALAWPAHIRRGDKLPCYDCHNPHGSRGYNNLGPNTFVISDERQGWNNLTDTKTDPVQSRRFCLGCHIPADGIPGSQFVEGIVMNAISVQNGHTSTDTQGCFECHGSDYSSPTSNNVHNPGT